MNMIEKVSRIICRQRGHDPDRRMQDYGKTSHAYYAWEGFREDAKENIRWTGARRPDVAAGCASSHFGYKPPGKTERESGGILRARGRRRRVACARHRTHSPWRRSLRDLVDAMREPEDEEVLDLALALRSEDNKTAAFFTVRHLIGSGSWDRIINAMMGEET